METRPPIIRYDETGIPTHIIVYKENHTVIYKTVPATRDDIERLFNNKSEVEEKINNK